MKIRTDFVSNSSSSSFIIVCNEQNDMTNYKNVAMALKDYDEQYEHHFFDGNTCLTLAEIDIKEFIEKEKCMTYSFIPEGICIPNEKLIDYFDSFGEVRKDLDFIEVYHKLNWYAFDKDKNRFCECDENEEIVYEAASIMGKITDKTVKFTKWFIENAEKTFGKSNVSLYENRYDFDKVSKAISDGKNLYYIRYSYQGDAQRYGHFYVDYYDDTTPTKTRLLNAKAIIDYDIYKNNIQI